MNILVVEDDFISRKILLKILADFGQSDVAVDGQEAVHAFKLAWAKKQPYDLICMDIMMPHLNGHEALKEIRRLENQMGINDSEEAKVIMTTALDDKKNVVEAFYKGGAASYFVKPIDRDKLIQELKLLGLIPE